MPKYIFGAVMAIAITASAPARSQEAKLVQASYDDRGALIKTMDLGSIRSMGDCEIVRLERSSHAQDGFTLKNGNRVVIPPDNSSLTEFRCVSAAKSFQKLDPQRVVDVLREAAAYRKAREERAKRPKGKIGDQVTM